MNNNFIPKEFQRKETYKCVEDIGNITEYTSLVDVEENGNFIYFCMGYGNDHDFDCPFFLSADDAMKLARLLKDASNVCKSNAVSYNSKEDMINIFNMFITGNSIKRIAIRVGNIFSEDITDSMFGKVTLNIKISTRLDDTQEGSYTCSIVSNESVDIISNYNPIDVIRLISPFAYDYLINSNTSIDINTNTSKLNKLSNKIKTIKDTKLQSIREKNNARLSLDGI